MKRALCFALLLPACGARYQEPPPPVTDPPATVAPTDAALLRSEPPICAFGAGAGHLVWIDAETKHVKAARAVAGSRARTVGIAAHTCALSVVGTRLCFGDSAGSLTCLSVDGGNHEILGERRAADPVRTVDLGRGRGLIFGRSRSVYGRFDFEESLTSRTFDADVVATAGDFEPSPDDGVELAVATTKELRRFSDGRGVPVTAPIAVRALEYSAYLVLSADGSLRAMTVGYEPRSSAVELGGFVHAFAHDEHTSGENLVAAVEDRIVAASGQLYFEPRLSPLRVVAPAGGEVVSLAIDDDEILWATRAGEIRRVKRASAP